MADAQHAVGQVAEVISYLRDPARFQAWAVRGRRRSHRGAAFWATRVRQDPAGPGGGGGGRGCPSSPWPAPTARWLRGGEGVTDGDREQALNQLLVEIDALKRSSDLADVVNEAAVATARSGLAHIGSTQMSEAFAQVLGGQRGRSVLTPAQLNRLAVHEAAHAVVATALGHGLAVQRNGRGTGQGHCDDLAADLVVRY